MSGGFYSHGGSPPYLDGLQVDDGIIYIYIFIYGIDLTDNDSPWVGRYIPFWGFGSHHFPVLVGDYIPIVGYGISSESSFTCCIEG